MVMPGRNKKTAQELRNEVAAKLEKAAKELREDHAKFNSENDAIIESMQALRFVLMLQVGDGGPVQHCAHRIYGVPLLVRSLELGIPDRLEVLGSGLMMEIKDAEKTATAKTPELVDELHERLQGMTYGIRKVRSLVVPERSCMPGCPTSPANEFKITRLDP